MHNYQMEPNSVFVQLQRGNILSCKLPIFEHTGIYVGDGQVVELHGSGYIRKVPLNMFVRRSNQIFVACDPTHTPLGNEDVALNAEAHIGKYWGYHLINNNCHRFTSGCLKGKFHNTDNVFRKLEESLRKFYNIQSRIMWQPVKW